MSSRSPAKRAERGAASAPGEHAARLEVDGRNNAVGAATGVRKLNGIVYTPAALARAIAARLPLRDGCRVLDPSCGEGVFLEAVLARAAHLGVRVHIEGWDIDAAALAAARARLKHLADALGCAPCWTLTHRDALDAPGAPPEPFDVVVGNPPYLEAKRMGDRQKARVRAAAPIAATGAFDLYAAFIELAAHLLRPDGTLSFIVPNRVAVTASTAKLRAWLLARGEVRLTDLSRDNPFPDAAVYPVVLELRAASPPALRIATLDGDALATLSPTAVATQVGGRWPLPAEPPTARLLERVLARNFPPLSNALEVRWTVSFHAAGLRDRYISEHRPDSPHARPFLGGGRFAGNREVNPFRIEWRGWWIDHHEDRARTDRNPLPPAHLFTGPKLVICQNARRARAAIDTDGFILKDTFLLARVREGPQSPWLEWAAIVLHSRLFHVLYEAMYGGTRKGGGYLHFLAGYLDPFPLPAPPEGLDLRELHRRLAAAAQDSTTDGAAAELHDLGALCEAHVSRAYELDADEERWVSELELPAF